MDKFPIMSMKTGDDVTVTTPDGIAQGLVEDTSHTTEDGWAVNVKLFGGGRQWFYARQGAEFWR